MNRMEEKEPKQKNTTRLAMIGLIGTVLTVCGGLAGALIGGATTIYKVHQETQRLAIAAPQSDQPLQVDTRQIAISPSKLSKLEPEKVMVYRDLGFVMAQSMSGWTQSDKKIYADLFLEQAANLSPLILFSKWIKFDWDEQPVRELRYMEPVMVQFLEGSAENGVAVDPTQLDFDSYKFYSQFIVLALDKAVAQKNFTLYELAMNWGSLHQGGVNSLVANPDSQYVFEQVSWELKRVRVNGHQADLTLQRWALFAQGPDRDYIIELQYVPAPGQSVQVWDDLQAYLDAFRVIH
jgi:hypothetical protein